MCIGAVIFDIGGCLVRTVDWSWRQKWEERLGLPHGGLSALVFDSEPAIQASLGHGTDSAIWQQLAVRFGLGADELTHLRQDFWAGDRANGELLQFLSQIRPLAKTGILSNAWPEMRDLNAQRFGLANAVDETVYSFEIGALKPDPEAYRVPLERLQLRAEQTAFVDDSLKNIAGARAVGMTTIHFQNTTQAITELQRLLLPLS